MTRQKPATETEKPDKGERIAKVMARARTRGKK